MWHDLSLREKENNSPISSRSGNHILPTTITANRKIGRCFFYQLIL